MSDKVNLLFVTTSDPSGESGNNIATKEIVTAFAKVPHTETTLVCPEPVGGLPEKVERHVDSTVYMPAKTDSSMKTHLRSFFDSFVAVREALKKRGEPDLMVVRMSVTMLAPSFFSRLYDIPYALLTRGVMYKTLRFAFLLKLIYRLNARAADEVYVASEEIKRDTDRMRKASQTEAKVLPNGVDADAFRPTNKETARRELGLELSDEDFAIGFVGSMSARHSVEELISALPLLEEVENAKILIVGDGPERERCELLVEELEVGDDVTFTGFVEHDEVPRYISACDVMYGVSEQVSATPIKCFEYLACERPIIVREIEDLEFVWRNEVGLSVAEISPENVAGRIRELYEAGEERRQAMGTRGREYVRDNHTWERFAEIVLKDFDLA